MKIFGLETNTATWQQNAEDRYIRVELKKTGMVFDIEETSEGLRVRTPQGLLSIHPEVGNSILLKTARTS